MKIATIVGTRPEIIRLSRVIAILERDSDHLLIHTGQNYDYELNEIFFDDLELRKPDTFLDAAGESSAQTIANIIAKADNVFSREKPDAVLVLGDTNSCLVAYAAKRRRIPVFHMEAGNRCFDDRVPEEINRRIVDHISDINLPYSSISRDYLLREGLPPDRIIKTGSPMYEVLHYYQDKIEASNILSRLELHQFEYILVSAHREENVESPFMFKKFTDLLNGLAKEFGKRVILSTHPRTRKRINTWGSPLDSRIELSKPFCFSDYIHLQLNAHLTLSDSGTITEESSILNFPALNIRETHERLEGMEEGSVMFTGMDFPRVVEKMKILDYQKRGTSRTFSLVRDYDVSNVSEKISRIIHSYTDFVRRVVWRENI